jgi:hypothetical protein
MVLGWGAHLCARLSRTQQQEAQAQQQQTHGQQQQVQQQPQQALRPLFCTPAWRDAGASVGGAVVGKLLGSCWEVVGKLLGSCCGSCRAWWVAGATMGGHHQSTIRAPSERNQSTIRAPSEHHQSTIRAPSEHHQSTIRAPHTLHMHTVATRWFGGTVGGKLPPNPCRGHSPRREKRENVVET